MISVTLNIVWFCEDGENLEVIKFFHPFGERINSLHFMMHTSASIMVWATDPSVRANDGLNHLVLVWNNPMTHKRCTYTYKQCLNYLPHVEDWNLLPPFDPFDTCWAKFSSPDDTLFNGVLLYVENTGRQGAVQWSKMHTIRASVDGRGRQNKPRRSSEVGHEEEDVSSIGLSSRVLMAVHGESTNKSMNGGQGISVLVVT